MISFTVYINKDYKHRKKIEKLCVNEKTIISYRFLVKCT